MTNHSFIYIDCPIFLSKDIQTVQYVSRHNVYRLYRINLVQLTDIFMFFLSTLGRSENRPEANFHTRIIYAKTTFAGSGFLSIFYCIDIFTKWLINVVAIFLLRGNGCFSRNDELYIILCIT